MHPSIYEEAQEEAEKEREEVSRNLGWCCENLGSADVFVENFGAKKVSKYK